jgi:hypothetical protein
LNHVRLEIADARRPASATGDELEVLRKVRSVGLFLTQKPAAGPISDLRGRDLVVSELGSFGRWHRHC